MRAIAIFAALQWECRPILRHLAGARRENMAGVVLWRAGSSDLRVVVVKTGVGPARAEAAARALSGVNFDLFLSSGCAGALASHLGPGDLIVGESVQLADVQAVSSHPEQRGLLLAAAERAGLRPHVGPLLTSPTMLATAAQKRAAAASGAIAVEMEGAAIASIAAERGIAFGAVRSILDTSEAELDQTGGFVDPATGSVRPLALASHLIRHPTAVAPMLAVKRMMDAAESSLERFFAEFLRR